MSSLSATTSSRRRKTVANRLKTLARRPSVKRVIVDLRLNGGGNNQTYGPLLGASATRASTAKDGCSCSSAARRSRRQRTSRPTSTGSRRRRSSGSRRAAASRSTATRWFLLPKSGINVNIATRYWNFGKGPGDRRLAIYPDKKVLVTVADFLAGRDPVLDGGAQGLTSANCGRFVRGTPCVRSSTSHSVVLAPSTERE